jgi:hypothetical protein
MGNLTSHIASGFTRVPIAGGFSRPSCGAAFLPEAVNVDGAAMALRCELPTSTRSRELTYVLSEDGCRSIGPVLRLHVAFVLSNALRRVVVRVTVGRP